MKELFTILRKRIVTIFAITFVYIIHFTIYKKRVAVYFYTFFNSLTHLHIICTLSLFLLMYLLRDTLR
ncbi:hypothetical protein IIC_04300 [Bacillus cereus VD021]|uniref:Uncharacterized protein n=1 Tax=Bacillus cereus VD021 TaxID=1053224 RepID=R8HFY7_BACCE|nr:hypothetical protein IIC_04300 [Bacillus cereus VD021]